ncbi:MAG: hypothetical protein MJ066_03870 [Clostridia bacterium]|nr:hypothetical protein [Clostridia bacterium]
MANELLTPSMIWANFVASKSFETEILSEEQRDNISLTRFFIDLKEENIKLYCVMATGKKKTDNAILSVQQYKTELKEDLIVNLAGKGYTAMLVDVCGNYEGKGDKYTIYPEELSFANYNEEQVDTTLVNGEIEKTCWYVWAKALKNAISFLKTKEGIEKVGVIGIGKVATSLWQAVSINNQVSCAVFVSDLGWRGYKGINKFSLENEPVFEDEKLSYLASIGPESYAHHVKCPVLMLSPTNSGTFDLDRSYDTLSRISGRAYTAINYSVGYRNSVDYASYKDALICVDKVVNSQDKKVDLPKEIEISCEIVDKKIEIEVVPQENNLKEVCLYASEENIESNKRTWRKITNVSKLVKSKYYF